MWVNYTEYFVFCSMPAPLLLCPRLTFQPPPSTSRPSLLPRILAIYRLGCQALFLNQWYTNIHRYSRPVWVSILGAQLDVNISLTSHLSTVSNTGMDVRFFRAWILLEDVSSCHTACQKVQNQRNSNPVTSYTWFPKAHVRIYCYPIEQLLSFHSQSPRRLE